MDATKAPPAPGEVAARSADGGGLSINHAPSAELRSAAPPEGESLSVRDQFPALGNWHYLDSAATAQKPQAVIDAITKAYARDYATVHRGVYERSASMTASYETARTAASNLIGGQPNELIFTRGATEAINL